MRARGAGSSALVAIAVAGLVGVPGVGPSGAHAAPKASVSVTIRAEGTDLSGVVKSSRPAVCAADRTVVVFKVRGTVGGGDDVRFASDTTNLSGGRYTWSTGNTGRPADRDDRGAEAQRLGRSSAPDHRRRDGREEEHRQAAGAASPGH